MAPGPGSVAGPLLFVTWAEAGAPNAADAELVKIISTIRPMKCDPYDGPKTGGVLCPPSSEQATRPPHPTPDPTTPDPSMT
jgi:hypothetical protein